MRAAIYARYSSDRQSETSAEDQARVCFERADREGWKVVATFSDLAISGATRDRPGLNGLLERATEFDIVLAESIDRLSRDQEDIAAIFKRLRFAGARIVTLSEGDISELHIGLKGTMGALFLKELGEKTKRGQIGRVAAGRIPGGLSYGYRQVRRFDETGEPEKGLREIHEDEAHVIRRIFADFLAGYSPRAIAEALNREGVPSPAGRLWRAGTITGSKARRNGILHNELYAGRIVYNRQRFEKHPVTRRRLSRPNPPSEWKVQEIEHLRIVDADTWAATAARFAGRADLPAQIQRRPRRFLSGLMKCGVCGGGVTIIGTETWGCSGARQGTLCTNRRTVSNKLAESRILNAMRESLMAPDLIKAFVEEWQRTMEEDRAEQLRERARVVKKRDLAQRRIDRLVEAIADGAASFKDVRGSMREATDERDRLDAELAEIEAPQVVALMPAIAEQYRRAIDNLVETIHGPSNTPEAWEELRSVINEVRLVPREDGPGVHLELVGQLAEILRIAEGRRRDRAGGSKPSVKLVAGTGFEPVTFRL